MSFNVWLIFFMALSQGVFQFLLGLYEDSIYIQTIVQANNKLVSKTNKD